MIRNCRTAYCPLRGHDWRRVSHTWRLRSFPERHGARQMTQSDERDPQPSIQDVALIVGGGPGISSSCARLFAENGMRVGVAARPPDKPVLQTLEKTHGVRRYACDASEQAAVDLLFKNVVRDLGAPTLLVHNIDG